MSEIANQTTVDEEDEGFYFESDHLALRGNLDYSEILKTMFVLQAQRNRAIQDFNKLVDIKKECLKDPLSYKEKYEAGILGLPPLQHIAEIPQINWSKYNTNVPEQFMRQINSTRLDQRQKILQPEKNTKAWTTEEQRKLEELLVKYPPEDVERRRFIKIAAELGTRTKEQVASRLQKYFVKLLNAGLPVPGRIPKAASKYYDRKKLTKRTSNPGHFHRKYMKPSTFFPDTIIPVVMDEFHAPGPSTSSSGLESPTLTQNDLVQCNYLISNNYHVDEKSKINKDDLDIEIDLLKWVKSEKMIETRDQLHQHYGYKCDYCGEEPIQGSRWHCTSCLNNSVDYCTDCVLSQFYSNSAHDLYHKFLVIRNEKEVSSGPWSDTESDSDSTYINESVTNSDEDAEMPEEENTFPTVASAQDDITEECPNDIFDTAYTNGICMRRDDFKE